MSHVLGISGVGCARCSGILWHVAELTGAASAFGTWPSALYFLYIAASTSRLDFALPTFTGAVAAIGYLGLVYVILPLDSAATDPALSPISHVAKASVMLVTGIVAGLVAVRLRQKFRTAVQASASRERVINLFGQHLSPAVVDRLLKSPAELTGETREICVMFLDIRDFTAHARGRRPELVVNFLNEAFAFMIEAVDRQGGFINKFLGDGFLAMFGAPLNDPAAARHAVAAAREILAEIDRRGGLAAGAWPLKVGIGLHLGPAVTGTIGSPRRKEFTAIGDTSISPLGWSVSPRSTMRASSSRTPSSPRWARRRARQPRLAPSPSEAMPSRSASGGSIAARTPATTRKLPPEF